jgi:hypothetical protein
MQYLKLTSSLYLASVLRIRICDPGSGAFLPPRSGIRIQDEFFSGSRISDPGFFYYKTKNCSGKFVRSKKKVCIPLFMQDPGCEKVRIRIRDEKNVWIQIRDPG